MVETRRGRQCLRLLLIAAILLDLEMDVLCLPRVLGVLLGLRHVQVAAFQLDL